MFVDGGFVMKLMDTCAGVVSHRWMRGPVVTVHIDAINFFSPLKNGELIQIYGRLIYTSKKSMEVMCLSFVERLSLAESNNNNNNSNSNNNDNNNQQPNQNRRVSHSHNAISLENATNTSLELVCVAFLTFVALNRETHKTIPVKQLEPISDIEKALWEEGKTRYYARKVKRQSSVVLS